MSVKLEWYWELEMKAGNKTFRGHLEKTVRGRKFLKSYDNKVEDKKKKLEAIHLDKIIMELK